MTILQLANVSKHFGAIHALDDVSLELHAGEVVGLMGDNGAGKSTLVRIMAGNFAPTHGTITMDGAVVTFNRPVDARRHGIEVVYQDLALCDNLTASGNVFMGRELRRWFGPLLVLDYRTMYPPRRRACSPSSSRRRGRGTSSARCPAASGRRWRSRAPASPRPRSC